MEISLGYTEINLIFTVSGGFSMKKKYIPALLLFLLAIALLPDCFSLYPRVDWSPDASSTSGIGFYLLGGLLKVREHLPYCDTPRYFIGLCIFIGLLLVLALLSFLSARRKSVEE